VVDANTNRVRWTQIQTRRSPASFGSIRSISKGRLGGCLMCGSAAAPLHIGCRTERQKGVCLQQDDFVGRGRGGAAPSAAARPRNARRRCSRRVA
jgi:hypothetical protein